MVVLWCTRSTGSGDDDVGNDNYDDDYVNYTVNIQLFFFLLAQYC